MTVRAGTCGAMSTNSVKPAEAAAGADEEPLPPPATLTETQTQDPPAASEETQTPLKEWAPLHHLTLQVPAKYQNLLVTGELQLTSVSAVEEHILLGTNTGSVYWYDAVSCTMQRYRTEGQVNAVTRVSAVTSVDHLLAAGHQSGDVSVFLVPRLARGDVPEYVRITERNIKKGLQFQVDAGHRSAVTALAWSRNAARLFSGDETGVVAVTEIDYITETVACRLVLREPSAVVQLQYSRQTLLVATRDRACLITWPDPDTETAVRQVGTKTRKSPADLGACFVETREAGLTVLAARPSLKIVTADIQGQVSATISLKPTLETSRPMSVLFPVSVPPVSEANFGPGRLVPLWPGSVALYDHRTLLVVDTERWEITWRCDQLPAVLDVAAAGDAIFVLCSTRRLIRLSRTPDQHPTVCENLRLASGDLSLEDVLQELRSAVPVTQVKTLLNSVHGQLGRSGLLGAISSRKEAVSSLTSRMSSLVAGRLGRAPSSTRESSGPIAASRGPLRPTISSPDVRPDSAGLTSSSPDVRESSPLTSSDVKDSGVSSEASPSNTSLGTSVDSQASALTNAGSSASLASTGAASSLASTTAIANTPVDEEPIARQVRPRRRPGRRRVARPDSGETRSLETVSLGGETAATSEGLAGVTGEETRPRSFVEEKGMRGGEREAKEEARGTKEERGTSGRTICAVSASVGSGPESGRNERLSDSNGVTERALDSKCGGKDGLLAHPAESSSTASTSGSAAAALTATPHGPLDFTRFYPSDVRPRLQKTDSELEQERQDKERRLAELLGLEELSVPTKPPPTSTGVISASPGSSAASSSPGGEEIEHREDSGSKDESVMHDGGFTEQHAAPYTEEPKSEPEKEKTETEPEPSYHTLFPFKTKPSTPPVPPPRPPSVDSETGEPRRQVIRVQYPDDPSPPSPAVPPSSSPAGSSLPDSLPPSSPPTASSSDLEIATELTEGSDPTSSLDWLPWQRHSAPSYAMTLSACSHYAVITDPDCRVYCTPASILSGPVWEKLDYSACQVAVSWDGQRVWRLEQTGAAYALADPEPGRPTGSHWVRAARDVLQLAADSAAVWYIKRGGKLFVQRDLSSHRCASPELAVDAPGPVIHVTARQGVVWAVTDQGSVLWRVGINRSQLAGFSWEPLSLGGLRARAAFLTAGELGWLVDDRCRLHVMGGVSATLPRGMDGVWRRMLAERSYGSSSGRQVAVMSPGAALRPGLAVEGDVAWLTEPGVMNVMTCRHHIIAVRWEQFVPRGRQLEWAEVHADSLYQRRGQLWALTAKGQLYGGHGHDGDLQVVPLPERGCTVGCISAAPGTLWLLTGSGAVYVREGMEQSATGTDWVKLDLLQIDGCRLVDLSVGAQSVWACDGSGRVLVRLGPTVARRSAAALQPAWVPVDQPPGVRFSLVCVGPADQPVWALDSAGVPWRRCGLHIQPVVGSHWQAAAGVSADRLAISPAGVWARARGSGLVHRWMEAAGRWCRVPGTTRHVSVSVSGELWVVHRGALYTLHEQSLRPGRCVVPRVTDRTPASPSSGDTGEDWELVTC